MPNVKKLVLGWAAFIFAATAFGQGITTGTVSGSVTDPSGAVVGNATVILVDAAPGGYSEKGRLQQPGRSQEKAWAHPVIANGKLYLRDQDLIFCYAVK